MIAVFRRSRFRAWLAGLPPSRLLSNSRMSYDGALAQYLRETRPEWGYYRVDGQTWREYARYGCSSDEWHALPWWAREYCAREPRHCHAIEALAILDSIPARPPAGEAAAD